MSISHSLLCPSPQGVARVRTSSDVVGALLKELRLQAGQPMEGRQEGFRLAVAVDGVNALWGRTSLKKEDKSVVSHGPVTSSSSLLSHKSPVG